MKILLFTERLSRSNVGIPSQDSNPRKGIGIQSHDILRNDLRLFEEQILPCFVKNFKNLAECFSQTQKSAECGRASFDWSIFSGCALRVGIAKANSAQPTKPR